MMLKPVGWIIPEIKWTELKFTDLKTGTEYWVEDKFSSCSLFGQVKGKHTYFKGIKCSYKIEFPGRPSRGRSLFFNRFKGIVYNRIHENIPLKFQLNIPMKFFGDYSRAEQIVDYLFDRR